MVNEDYKITLTRDELVMINNALNETCNGLDIREFQARTGYTKKEMELLLEKISQLVN